jgi:hypothetical protein
MAESGWKGLTVNAPAEPVHLDKVLEGEFRELHGSEEMSSAPPENGKPQTLWDRIHNLPCDGRTALCLSGGGVRSAAFNLGVLQGLARLELLNRFHYLSTVSGGGYIGCWLSAWRRRSDDGNAEVVRGLSWPDRIDDAEVSPRVPDAIGNLRCFTNYLTPAAGFLSGDSWASIVIVGRNLILNHIVIVPLIAALLVLAKLVGAVAHEHCVVSVWEWWNANIPTLFEWFLAVIFAGNFPIPGTFASYIGSFFIPGVFAAFGWIILSIARPSWDGRRCFVARQSRARLAGLWPPRVGIVLVLIGAILFGLIASKNFPIGPHYSWDRGRFWAFPIGGLAGALVGFGCAVGIAMLKLALCRMPSVAHRAARILGYIPRDQVTVPTAGFWAIAMLAVAAGVSGFAGGLVLGAGEELAAHLPAENPVSTALVLSIAPLWFVISYNAGDAVFLGLTARRPKPRPAVPGDKKREWADKWGDEEREWVARTAGCLTLSAIGISILLLLSLFGAYLFDVVISGEWKGLVLGTAVILSAVASIGLAASPFSSHFGTAPHGARLPVRTILVVATPIFAGLLASLLSSAIDLILFTKPLLILLQEPERRAQLHLWFDPTTGFGQGSLVALCVVLVIFSCCAALFVNINRFSLYDLYRMRLTREFLGASNGKHRPEVWTGFDERDDIPLAQLWPSGGPKDNQRRLYPVINATLNMAATKRLDWQERKAVSFVFTPHYCGSGATDELGFRPTQDYAGGINLGWAMSVSGAAVSPNAGYSTLPGLALLMTLFNLRLGVWSGNPGSAGRDSWQLRGPRFGLRPLLSEALARTNDQSKYVYLSDGGHFDNLGLYEMLRRRCRFIVVSDATSDPDYVYADLGSVMRKAAIDFGIRITFRHLDMGRPDNTAVKGAYSALAVIEYPEKKPDRERKPDPKRKSDEERQCGYLLYVKSYCGGLQEPADVRAYGHANPAFPHDTTFDQFFGEAQFESYRALGCYTMMELGRRAGFAAVSSDGKPASLRDFFDGAREGLGDGVPEDKPNQSALRFRQLSEANSIHTSYCLKVHPAVGRETNNGQAVAASAVSDVPGPACPASAHIDNG